MKHQSIRSQLQDYADLTSSLAGFLQNSPFEMKESQLRSARTLIATLEGFFSTELRLEAKTWQTTSGALQILESIATDVQKIESGIARSDIKMNTVEKSVSKWKKMGPKDQSAILAVCDKIKSYMKNDGPTRESHILHRHQRYEALKPVLPFADNARHLCEGISHYENMEKYESNIERLEAKIVSARQRLHSVKRGFWVAIILCAFIVTIPLCLPASMSLWKRILQIQTQIADAQESIRREKRRIEMADEGMVAAESIRNVLGPLTVEQIKEVLQEIVELRYEFSHHARGVSSELISYFDLNVHLLEDLFGPKPNSVLSSFEWILECVEQTKIQLQQLEDFKDQKQSAKERLDTLLKGHSVNILLSSLQDIRKRENHLLEFGFKSESKVEFASLCLEMPELLNQATQVLRSTTPKVWNSLSTQLMICSQKFSLCLLECDSVSGTAWILKA